MTDLKKTISFEKQIEKQTWLFEKREILRNKTYEWVEKNKDKHKESNKKCTKARNDRKKEMQKTTLFFEKISDAEIRVSDSSKNLLASINLLQVPRYVKKAFMENKNCKLIKALTYYDYKEGVYDFAYTNGINLITDKNI